MSIERGSPSPEDIGQTQPIEPTPDEVLEGEKIVVDRSGDIVSSITHDRYEFRTRLHEPEKGLVFHLSKKYLGKNVELEPRLPPDPSWTKEDAEKFNPGYDNDFEDNPWMSTVGSGKTVSFSPAPEKALLAAAPFQQKKDGFFYIYAANKKDLQLHDASGYARDYNDTKELRSFDPAPVRLLGVIEFERTGKATPEQLPEKLSYKKRVDRLTKPRESDSPEDAANRVLAKELLEKFGAKDGDKKAMEWLESWEDLMAYYEEKVEKEPVDIVFGSWEKDDVWRKSKEQDQKVPGRWAILRVIGLEKKLDVGKFVAINTDFRSFKSDVRKLRSKAK
jgi:hypothetical protein